MLFFFGQETGSNTHVIGRTRNPRSFSPKAFLCAEIIIWNTVGKKERKIQKGMAMQEEWSAKTGSQTTTDTLLGFQTSGARWCKQDSQGGTERHIPQRLLHLGLPLHHLSLSFPRPSCQGRSWCHSCQRLFWQNLFCFGLGHLPGFGKVWNKILFFKTVGFQHLVVWENHGWTSVLDFWEARLGCITKARELRLERFKALATIVTK